MLARLKVGAAPTTPGGVAGLAGVSALPPRTASISFIDAATSTVLKTVNDAPNSTGIAVAPNGAKAYVTHLFSIDLTVIDAATDSLGTPVTMFLQRLRGGFGFLAVTPDNQTIYVANKANEAFGIIDLAGGPGSSPCRQCGRWTSRFRRTAAPCTAPAAKQICTPGFVQLYDVPSRIFTKEIAVQGSPYRIVLSPNGANAYVANLSGPSVSFIDLATPNRHGDGRGTAAQPTGLGIEPGRRDALRRQPDGAGVLGVVDVAGATVRAQLPVYQARDVAVSPDGGHVYVSSNDAVLVIDPAKL